MEKICLVYVRFGIGPGIWNGLRMYTEVPLYMMSMMFIQLLNQLQYKKNFTVERIAI